ncbi:hypothetical protein M9434_001688 [Picochlorum sp. BPE23]|nr:hypothetical protein M9434_001688 [Picochlorum sp. BPE23]
MVVQGNQELFDTVEAVVEDGVLYVQSPKAAQSDNGDVVAIISAPKDAIKDLTVSGNGDVYLVDGFTSPSFQIVNSGNGDVEADLAVSDTITVRVEDNGDVELVGSFGSLDLTLSGNGDFDIFGLTGNANVKLEGNGDAFIGGSAQTVISGSQTGNGELEYSGGGTCSVQSEFAEDTCQREDDEVPDFISLPKPSSSESVRNSVAICAKGGAAPSSPASTSPGDITTDDTSSSPSSSGYRTLPFVAISFMMMTQFLI